MPVVSNAHNFVITGGTFNVTEAAPPLPSILEYVAYGAMHDSWQSHNTPPKCHPDTRLRIQDQIMHWIEDNSSESCMYWMTGPAGTGKTAIAGSIAKLCEAKGILVGSFFFLRLANDQNTTRTVITTIGRQLIRVVPDVKDRVESAMRDSTTHGRSLWHQLHAIVLEPLFAVSNGRELPFVIILDGLDECSREEERKDLIHAFSEAHKRYSLHWKVFITSRPEYDIQDAFRRIPDASRVSKFDLSEDLNVDDDIRLFLTDMFAEIKASHPFRKYLPKAWPPQGAVDTLVSQSSGQFVYPATIIKYLESVRDNPATRLDILLGLRPTPTNDKPFAQLDALYTHIFSNAKCLDLVLTMLACIVAQRGFRFNDPVKFHPKLFDQLLFLTPGQSHEALIDLVSIIRFDSPNQSIHILHASLTDFLLDHSRAGDVYFIGDKITAAHVKLTRGFLNLAPAAYPTVPIMTIWGDLVDTYIPLIHFHCCKDSVIEQVVDDLIAFDVPSFVSSFGNNEENHVFHDYVMFIRPFMANDKAERVYHHHSTIIDHLIRQSLPAYLQHATLIRYLVLISTLSDMESRYPLRHIGPHCVDLRADSWSKVKHIDARGLRLHRPEEDGPLIRMHEHQRYLSYFLRDPTRSADLALKASHYISTVDYLCNVYSERRLDFLKYRDSLKWDELDSASLAVLLIRLTEDFSEEVLTCLIINRDSLVEWLTKEGAKAATHHRKAALQIRLNYSMLDPPLPDLPSAAVEKVKNVEDFEDELSSSDSGDVETEPHNASQLERGDETVQPSRQLERASTVAVDSAAFARGSFVPLILVLTLVVVVAVLVRQFTR